MGRSPDCQNSHRCDARLLYLYYFQDKIGFLARRHFMLFSEFGDGLDTNAIGQVRFPFNKSQTQNDEDLLLIGHPHTFA